MRNFTKKEQIGILILVFVVFVFAFWRYWSAKEEKTEEMEMKQEQLVAVEIESEKPVPMIMIHIVGEVNSPGVFSIQDGQRLSDVVEMAGGLTPYADVKRINLAREVRDQEKIYILGIGEESNPLYDTELDIEGTSLVEKGNSELVDLNSADITSLCSLPGIGESKAKAIIEYRVNQPFCTIEDITKVNGIGEKTFEKLKGYIMVR